MTTAQWQKLLDLLGNSSQNVPECLSGESLSTGWLIDSDASHHVTSNISLLHNIVNISKCPIGLPDEKDSYSTKKGDAILCPNLDLKMCFMFQI